MNSPAPLNPPPRLLLGPGPSDVHPRVLRALASPVLGHLDPQFVAIMARTQELLRAAFLTRNPLTFPVSGTGMAGLEACLVNLLEPGDPALVCVAGFFGQRLAEVAARAGAKVTALERPWGEVFDPWQVREALQRTRPRVLVIVHAETSTGAWQPVEDLGAICRDLDTLLVLDTVTSLGCVPLRLDDWGVDAAYSCSQKGLGCPPGLAPVSFSPRAVEAIKRRKSKVQSWYLDATLLERYWGEEHVYHHTTPVNMVYALCEGLCMVQEEGLESRWARHLHNSRALAAGLTALGLAYIAAEDHRLPQLNAVRFPAGVDDDAVRRRLLEEFGIEIGGGLGEYKGKAWRIGLMGYGCRPANVLLLLAALERCLAGPGAKAAPGAAVAAAERAYGV
jgi:alanine-glyoxylate transaminase/serine-glyoxylate transaminase/serine-pyruvate transaminase